MSKNWERHNRRNPCPVCGETKHCRTNKDNGLVHCRGDNPSSDYRFLKEDKYGFGIYKLEADIEREKEERKEEWLIEKRREREQRQRQREEQLKQQLTIEERDKAIRRVLSQLNLNATDREKLRGRGLTDDQINEAQYRSVKKWQDLDGVTVALPGINRRGNMNNPWDGILIPIPNEDGLWVGMRLHDPNNKETGNAKYIPLSSPKSGKTFHLRNGEIPIAVYYPSEYQHCDRIGLCEGLEWKPKIAAERLGYPVIGFSGCHFDTSPETLKIALQKIQEKLWIIQQEQKSSRKLDNKSSVSNGRVKETEISISKGLPPKTSTLVGEKSGTNTQNGQQTLTVADPNISGLNSKASETRLFLIPDGGMSANPIVFEGFQKTAKLLNGWGYTNTSILDWGQLNEKGNNDIDEISSEVLESAIAIPASEFLKSPEQKLREEEKKAQAQREEEEAGGKVISKDEWLTQKADEFWDNIKKKTGKSFNGFDQKENKKKRDRALSGVKLIYGKDALPTPECSIELPKIQFEQGERLSLLQELFDLGWENILDTSAAGNGKSHDSNLLSKDVDEEGKTIGKIWYLHGDHRNPTVEPAERKADLPSRHNGLIKDNSRTTPSGEPFQRRWQWSEEKPSPDIPSNCPETDRFNTLSTKGYDIHAKTREAKQNAQNPICAQCPILHECIETGYKAARKSSMESSEVRAHPDSLPSPSDYEYKDDTLLWEEASTQFQPTETRSLSKHDLEQQWEWLERENPEAYDRLRPIKHKLNDILSGKVDLPRFGANTFPDAEDNADLRSLLGVEVYPELESDLLILKAINDRAASLDGVEFAKADHVSVNNFSSEKEKRKWKGLQKTVNSMLRGQARNENRDANAALPTLGLYELILVLFKDSEAVTSHRKIDDIFGHAVINHGELSLTLNNSRHRAIASQAKNNIFLDATIRPQDLAKSVGIDQTKLITIEQRQPDYSNLTIHGIHIEGMKSKDHSDDCNRRKEALVSEIKSLIPEGETSAVLSFKNDAIAHDGYWFNDSRGTNRFKGVNHLIALGTPYQNYGAIKAEYYVTRRTLDGFDEYYNHLKEAEIIQSIGRQRAQLFPDQQFSIYLIGTDLDLTFLEEMGIKVDQSHGLEWTPEAGTQSQSLKLNLVQKAIDLGDKFWKLTQTEIAKKLGVTQGRISQLLKSVGGKANLKKLLMSLYKSYIGGLIKSKSLMAIKEIQYWLNLSKDDLTKMGLEETWGDKYSLASIDGILEALEKYFKEGGSPDRFEEDNHIPLFLAAAIALGASPPE